MTPRYPESAEERAARLVATAGQLATPDQGALEAAGPALPGRGAVEERMASRLQGSGIPDAAAKPIAASTAARGMDLVEAAGRGDLRIDDLADDDATALEAVISVIGRPAWFVRKNMPDTADVALASDKYWLVHINNQFLAIKDACRRVGVIRKQEDGARTPVGTGWVIGPRLIATNAHVAEHLFRRKIDAPADDPLQGWRPRSAVTGAIDFRFEHDGQDSDTFEIDRPCFIESRRTEKPDLAILSIRPRGDREPPERLDIETDPARPQGWSGNLLFTVGHPIADLQHDTVNVGAVFGALDGTKRFSPGEARGRLGDYVLAHDCSTVNGSSGSAVVDFASLKVVGLHYWGRPGERNESVLLPAIGDHPALVKSLAGGFGF